MRYLVGFICVLALGVMGCGEPAGTPPDDSPYASKDLWLCRPDMESDRCSEADLSVTEIQPDGTRTVSEVVVEPDAEVDCFFVYHTVNHDPEPGNAEWVPNTDPAVVEPVFKIAAHYRGTCRVFAPVYRQMSYATYFEHTWVWPETEFFKKGYDDVVEAFEYYMRNHNEGRDIILIGHSQGSHVLARMIQEKFDDDEALRKQLVSAVLMGPTAAMQVPEGESVGGTFANIPLCTSAPETGCAIAFDANPAGVATFIEPSVPIVPSMERACVNPASFDPGPHHLSNFTYPRTYADVIPFPDEVETEWVRYPKLFKSWCAEERGFAHVLRVDLADDYMGDVPITPTELQDNLRDLRGLNHNLHGAEYFLTNTDLVSIVEQQIASRSN